MSDGPVLRKDVSPEIPEDVDDARLGKASGILTLPLSVAWSDVDRRYDLDDRYDRARVYEQVLAEGTAEDVRRFIHVDDVIDLWDDLWLPAAVELAWARWLLQHRGVTLAVRHPRAG
ncbi:hypothetical protein [Euzebya pacifica]|uniref:hypothetical protein n=1 Tax=Euzebya pacifica TaxID=1608957 RepID=UPI0013DFE599|nr:hypothetical protein [Euzebya pacifica]